LEEHRTWGKVFWITQKAKGFRHPNFELMGVGQYRAKSANGLIMTGKNQSLERR
jgi:hypothetical protein